MAQISAAAPSFRSSARRRSGVRRIEVRWGLMFILPWIVGFLLFGAFPMAASLYLSFTNYSLAAKTDVGPQWIGLTNYSKLFSLDVHTVDPGVTDASKVLAPGYTELMQVGNVVVGATDPFFWKSLRVTLLFAVIGLPSGLAMALILALLTNLPVPGVRIFRTIFYLPYVVPAVASGLIFQQVLNRDVGWLNVLLKAVGLSGPNWLNDEALVLPALALIGLWGVGNAMLLYLAGLQGVPTDLYEAAKIDGANSWHRLISITLPMISPVILYNLVIGLITVFQYFTTAYIIGGGQGNPNYSTLFYNLYLYNQAFVYTDMGYASAMAWVLMIIVLTITGIVFATSRNWVFYASGPK